VVYEPPTRLTFKTTLQRALRDPGGQVFPSATLDDFIDEALMDMSAYRPKDAYRSMSWMVDSGSVPPDVTEGLSDVWQVIARLTSNKYETGDPLPYTYRPSLFIPHVDYTDGRAGWDFIGEGLAITQLWADKLRKWAEQANEPVTLAIRGYAHRLLPTSDNSYLDFLNPIDQYCVLQHCKFLGFQMLNADRALYQQWLAATNNTDVSPTQLQGMLGQAEATYDRVRHRNTIIRRRPSNASVTTF
jgi:hypothetical protein